MLEEPPQDSAETPESPEQGESTPSLPAPQQWPMLPLSRSFEALPPPQPDSSTGPVWEQPASREPDPSQAPGAEARSTDFIWQQPRQPSAFPPPPWARPTASTAEKKTRAGTRAGRLARDLIETIILALLIFVGVRAMVQNFRVEGSSMEGSLHNGQYILVNKAAYFEVDLSVFNFLPFFDAGDHPVHYIFGGPRRGDVIVFKYPGEPDRDFIKRIIGVPGDTVEIKDDGLVYVNGHALAEPYELERPNNSYGPAVVPEGEYFVLGDNRNNSFDSRNWGFVPEKDIIGKAWVSYFPFSDFGFVSSPNVKPLGTQEATP
jgi:signal peptidase I